MNNLFLLLSVFIAGCVVMILELIGTRIFAPYYGTTIDILTAIISIILVSLSLGYWVGGKIADKKPNSKNLAPIFIIASLLLVTTFSFTEKILTLITQSSLNNKISVFISSIIFFFPVNFLLSMVSPYAIRLNSNQKKESGSIAGTIYAVGTAGSIVGTVITGLILIPLLSIDKIIYTISLTLFIVGLTTAVNKLSLKTLIIFSALFILISVVFFRTKYTNKFLVDFDSMYQHISVQDIQTAGNNKSLATRLLLVNRKCCESGMILNNPNELLIPYTKYFKLSRYFEPDAKRFLMIGGGGYSFPKYLLANYPGTTIDVVEIDPKMSEIAVKYFYLKDNPRLRIYTEDGRVFLNKNNKKYDVIIVDVFQGFAVPFHLTTKEAVEKLYNSLVDNGLVITNIVSDITRPNNLSASQYLTYKFIFPEIYPIQMNYRGYNNLGNTILISFKKRNQKILPPDIVLVKESSMSKKGMVLSDNYAPVENMFIK